MVSLRDARGLRVTAGGRDAVELLDGAVTAYLGARADTRERVGRLLSADPGCVMGHVLDGYLAMLSSKREGTERARDAWAVAASVARRARASRREVLHVEALDAWSRGDMRAVVRYWDALLADYPRDILALKASQFVLSYLGESGRMRDTVERALPAWDPGVPGYGFVLGCHAYALEEAGDYAPAEETGRRAVELNRADIWAAHAVAHVAEMQGRLREGIAWVALLAGEWGQCSNFAFHLRWHEGLYHLDLEEYGRVLELYDREVRAQPSDEYLDITNAVSLLWRLEQAEVDVGPRWHELAERARAHLDDHALVFVDVHYLMALVAARDDAAAGRFLESCERFAAAGAGTEAAVMADVGLPLARGAWAHRRGVYGEAVDLLLPIRSRVREIGGSHAQRDVFEQMLIDAAWRAGQLATALEELDRIVQGP
ncbi:MAG: tetratricopeptide repeat protein, partial [Gemmatimonadaceae bacterium]